MRLPRQMFVSVLLAPALVAGCGGAAGDSASDQTASGSSTESSPPPAAGLRDVAVGGGPVGLAVVDGRVWVVDSADGSISSLTPGLDSVESSAPEVGRTPLRIASLNGVLWISSFGSGRLVGYDSRGGGVRSDMKVGAEPEGVAVLEDSIWVVLQRDARLVEVDPRSGKVVRHVSVGARPRQVAAAFGRLWVSDFPGGDVFAVDPGTLDVEVARNVCSGPQAMAAAGGLLWVSCTESGEVVGVDPVTLSVAERVTGLDHPDGLAVDGSGRLLVALQAGPDVAVVDPSSAALVTTVSLGRAGPLGDRANIDIAVVGDTMVVSSFLDGKVLVADVPKG